MGHTPWRPGRGRSWLHKPVGHARWVARVATISFSIGATIIKTDSLGKISADDQALMAKIAKGMQKTLRKQIRKDNDSALKQMERKGVKVSATSDAMLAEVDKAAQQVWAELTGKLFTKAELATVLKYRDEYRAKHAAK